MSKYKKTRHTNPSCCNSLPHKDLRYFFTQNMTDFTCLGESIYSARIISISPQTGKIRHIRHKPREEDFMDDEIIGYWPPGVDVNKAKCGRYTEKWRQNNKKAHIGIKHTEETKRKLREIRLGKKHTPETLQLLSKLQSGEKNPMYGKAPHNKGIRTAKQKTSKPKKEKIPKPPKEKRGKAIGEKHPKNTTSETTARAIKTDLNNGMRLCDVVRKYGVTKSVVSNIKHGYSWKWL